MGLFNRKTSNASKQEQTSKRADGYNAYKAQIVCLFQQTIEQEIGLIVAQLPASEQKQAQIDMYDGLRAALLKARSDDMYMIGYDDDDLMRLRSVFHDSIFASAQIAYIAR